MKNWNYKEKIKRSEEVGKKRRKKKEVRGKTVEESRGQKKKRKEGRNKKKWRGRKDELTFCLFYREHKNKMFQFWKEDPRGQRSDPCLVLVLDVGWNTAGEADPLLWLWSDWTAASLSNCECRAQAAPGGVKSSSSICSEINWPNPDTLASSDQLRFSVPRVASTAALTVCDIPSLRVHTK